MSIAGQPATSTPAPFGGIAFTGSRCDPVAASGPSSRGMDMLMSMPKHGGARSWSTASASRPSTCTPIAALPAAMAVISHPLEAPGLLMDDTSTRLAAMDAQGIDVEALSINPYWYRAERDAAAG